MAPPNRPGEFALIAELFAPLAAGAPGALGLLDDAALIAPAPGAELVVTTDTLVEGRHFLPRHAPDLVARKLLRVNLSDLAAMGAAARGYLLSISLPDAIDGAWLRAFAAGLAADQAAFAVALIGGDSTATPGPLTLTVTAFGEVPTGAALRRGGAAAGERVFVSGTIGDAALGLRIEQGGLPGLAKADAAALVERYLLPRPRLALGVALRGTACAAVDVSDGLVADLGHICTASGVAAEIEAGRVPLSRPAAAALAAAPELLETVLAGGDDYELVFTAPARARAAVVRLAAAAGIAVAEIGWIVPGAGVTVRGRAGAPITLRHTGFTHY